MTTLYVREQGARVCRDGERVRVMHGQETLHEAIARDLDQVVIYGNVQVTTQAATLLVQHDVDVVFYSQHGRYKFRFQDSGARYARLRQAQLRLADKPERVLAIAHSIVRGKLENQQRLLHALAEGATAPAALLRRAQTGVQQMAAASARAQTPDELRGFEGKGAAFYFEAMQALVPPAWGFHGRAYYPPPDPWNATLSFGYSLLLKDVNAVVQRVGLDPYVGFFHALEPNRPSLVLDLMEEYRPLVDDVCLRLLAQGKLALANYRRQAGEDRPVEMGPTLLPVLIQAYEQRLEQSTRYAPTGEQTSMRRCLGLQARQMASLILDQVRVYRPMPLSFDGAVAVTPRPS